MNIDLHNTSTWPEWLIKVNLGNVLIHKVYKDCLAQNKTTEEWLILVISELYQDNESKTRLIIENVRQQIEKCNAEFPRVIE